MTLRLRRWPSGGVGLAVVWFACGCTTGGGVGLPVSADGGPLPTADSAVTSCGDGTCQPGESIFTCPADCRGGACDGVTCAPREAHCDGDVAVRDEGQGRVTGAGGDCGCDYDAVEVRDDCGARGIACREGDCVDGPDACESVSCPPLPPVCDGDVAVAYPGDGRCTSPDGICDYAEVERRTDCGAEQRRCVDGECEDGPTACRDVSCPPEAPVCDGVIAVRRDQSGRCDPNDGACAYPDEFRIDCEALGEICEDGACGDPCAGVNCPPLEATCEGGVAVRYAGPGQCAAGEGVCDYRDAVRQVDCEAEGRACRGGQCVNLCGAGCAPPPPSCSGDVQVLYTGEGRCDEAEGVCDYAAVERRADCADDARVCRGGACVDLCADVTCARPADFCAGDIAVEYTGAPPCVPVDGRCDEHAVERRVDCGAAGEACRDGTCVDLCAGVDCQVPAARCEGDVAARWVGESVCRRQTGSCELLAEARRIDCGATDRVCDAGECVDLCADQACDPPAAHCDASTVVSYVGRGDCRPDSGQCDFSRVVERRDCAAAGDRCVAGRCETICVGGCPAPADRCDGSVALSYGGDGVCDPVRAACDYRGVETRTDCSDAARLCAAGRCLDPQGGLNESDVVITEVMKNPNAVSDNAGEWFEIFNTTGRDIDLRGVQFAEDDGDSAFFVEGDAAVVLAAGDWFVLGNNGDRATNGGIEVDYAYRGFNLANPADSIVISAPDGTRIDRLLYDENDFPDTSGIAMQLDGASRPEEIDNADPAHWCNARTAIDPASPAGDRGTPGAANLPCDGGVRELSILAVRDAEHPDHPAIGDTVRIVGAVVTVADDSGYIWIQEPAGGPLSGLFVDDREAGPGPLTVGDEVTIQGTYSERFNLATVDMDVVEITGRAALPPIPVLAPATLANPATAEPFESTLVRVAAVEVTDSMPDDPDDFGEFIVGGALRVDDLLYGQPVPPIEGTTYQSIVGVLNFSFGAYKLEPRDAGDIGGRQDP